MKHLTSFLCLAIAIVLSGCGIADQSDTPDAQAGIRIAREWLAMVDAGTYADSWSNSANFFRVAVPCDQWVTSMTAFRAPMGANASRKVKRARIATTLPGAPDGRYVLIEFASSFASKKEAVETATVMLETNGEWRVSGYFIR
jgi:hypothetical protein